jgi:hypothetical protein
MGTMLGRELWVVKEHWFGCRGSCPSCQVALKHNLFAQYCHCGNRATGYRTLSADSVVEFFCDEHFQDLPESQNVIHVTQAGKTPKTEYSRVGRR